MIYVVSLKTCFLNTGNRGHGDKMELRHARHVLGAGAISGRGKIPSV